MPEQVRPRVFVSYSLRDDEGRALRDALSQIFEIKAPEMLTGSVARRTALRQSLMDVDVAVVVLPPPDDPSRSNVLFEAGAATGAGVPLVLVGEAASAPGDLAETLVFEIDRVDDVIDAIEELTRSRHSQSRAFITDQDEGSALDESQGVNAHPESALPPNYVDAWISRLRRVRTERGAIRLIAELFQNAGARALLTPAGEGQIVDKPDLVLWYDDLLATFGLPLPVEVLLHSKSWPAVRDRLERTLAASGGRTLVAMVVRGDMKSRIWTDGRRTILACSANQLAEELARMPLAEAFSAVLTSAAA